ncbi:hypothetical protein JXA63_00655 [Candidatus Woesebacteria bacterium]|nr:hypothetical protein [Candidatus Woesebacteria bacterium]
MNLSKKSLIRFLTKKRQKTKVWLLISLLSSLFVLMFLYTSGAIPILYVNGYPIYGPEVTSLINEHGISGAFEKSIEYKLIQFEANRRNIKITAQEKYEQYLKLKRQAELQGTTIAEMIAKSGQTYEEFAQNVETTITIYRLLGEDLYISEDEVDKYFYDNNLLFENVDNSKLREDVKQVLFNEKLSERYADFIKEARANSDIDYFLFTE